MGLALDLKTAFATNLLAISAIGTGGFGNLIAHIVKSKDTCLYGSSIF